jgi:hypothetical protein
MPGTILGDVASHHQLYLAAKPSHVGADMDGIACPQHRPIVYSHQTREQSFLSDAALSHHAALGGGAFSGMQSPQAWIFYAGLTIWVSGLLNLYME